MVKVESGGSLTAAFQQAKLPNARYSPSPAEMSAARGTRTPNRQIRGLPAIVRLVACGPPVGLSYSVKNSVNDGLSKVEHQISGLVLFREGGRSRPAAIRRLACGVEGGHEVAWVVLGQASYDRRMRLRGADGMAL
jgi:hypothetical protein